MKRFLIILMTALFAFSCEEKPVSQEDDALSVEQAAPEAPSEVAITQFSNTKVVVKWKDNSSNEVGFDVFSFDVDLAASDKEAFNSAPKLGEVKMNETSFTFEGHFEVGHSYYVGVQAKGEKENSKKVWKPFQMVDLSTDPIADIQSTQEWPACLEVQYSLKRVNEGDSYGLCWSMEHTPTLKDEYQYGPAEKDGNIYFQVIPNMGLQSGKDVHVRAFVERGKDVYYSKETKMKLTKEFPAIHLDWEPISCDVPNSIKMYKTTTPLNGRLFNAWYAIADVKKDVELRVLDPGKNVKMLDQYNNAGDCYVLVNGGFFYNGSHIGITVRDSQVFGSIWGSRGSLDKNNDPVEYNKDYWMTRGTFGVDVAGNPGAVWATTGSDNQVHYFDKPLPTVVGECKYARASSGYPCPQIDWKPKYAISGGPMLVYEDNVCFDFSTTPRSKYNYICNYEVMAYDIFGNRSGTPDRTAIGCTKDGKVILFVCDGRIKNSKGATLVELAQIMKGLGCEYAVNLDGGGSTAMVAGGERLNSLEANTSGKLEDRAVVSTVGFFKKK